MFDPSQQEFPDICSYEAGDRVEWVSEKKKKIRRGTITRVGGSGKVLRIRIKHLHQLIETISSDDHKVERNLSRIPMGANRQETQRETHENHSDPSSTVLASVEKIISNLVTFIVKESAFVE